MKNLFLTVLGAGLLGCSGDVETTTPPKGDPFSTDPGTTVVIGAGDGGQVITPDADGCFDVDGTCLPEAQQCAENEKADIIVDANGKVLEVVCYPADSTPPPVSESGDVALGNENGGVVSVDGNDDGTDVEGDVSAEGNNVVVYGQGAGVSVIGGSVSAVGNNFALRGVRVLGDVVVDGNNAALVLSVFEGSVTITGNNTVIAESTFLGPVTMTGNNSVVVTCRFAANPAIVGDNTVCESNFTGADTSGDKLLSAEEAAAPLVCQK